MTFTLKKHNCMLSVAFVASVFAGFLNLSRSSFAWATLLKASSSTSTHLLWPFGLFAVFVLPYGFYLLKQIRSKKNAGTEWSQDLVLAFLLYSQVILYALDKGPLSGNENFTDFYFPVFGIAGLSIASFSIMLALHFRNVFSRAADLPGRAFGQP